MAHKRPGGGEVFLLGPISGVIHLTLGPILKLQRVQTRSFFSVMLR